MINISQDQLDSIVSLTELEVIVDHLIDLEYASYDASYVDPAELDWDHAWQSAQDTYDSSVYGS